MNSTPLCFFFFWFWMTLLNDSRYLTRLGFFVCFFFLQKINTVNELNNVSENNTAFTFAKFSVCLPLRASRALFAQVMSTALQNWTQVPALELPPLKSKLFKRSFGPKVTAISFFFFFFFGLRQDQNNPISLILRITITPVWVIWIIRCSIFLTCTFTEVKYFEISIELKLRVQVLSVLLFERFFSIPNKK